ncbi:hypothetical protein ABFS82_04G202800 [Erythranthe guttata]
MEIPALVYFSCWSIITATFLSLGFKSLNHHEQINNNKPHFSPLLIFLLQRFLTTSVCHSSTYSLVHRPHHSIITSLTTHLKLTVIGFSLPSYLYVVSGRPIQLHLILAYAFVIITIFHFFFIGDGKEVDFGLYVDFLVRLTVFSLTLDKRDRFFPVFVAGVSFLTAGLSAAMFDVDNRETAVVGSTEMERRMRFVGIGFSILAGVAFQVFLRIKLFGDVVGFLCFGVAWLGCVAMVMPCRDFGVLDWFVCNVLVGCVNEFGLYGPTWFAYAASVVLFVLHPKVRAVRYVPGRDVILW